MKTVGIAILLALCSAAAFYGGTRLGVKEHYFADAQYRASVTAAQLRLIELGRIEDLKSALEISLNGDIARHADYLDSNWKWIWPELQPQTPRAIKSAVQYRVTHPFTEPDLSDPKHRNPDVAADDPFVLEIVEAQREDRRKLERVIQRYTDDGS